MGLWQNCSNTKCQGLSNPSGAVIGVRAMLCMSLMSGLIGWAVGMVALIVHRPRFLFTVALAFGIQAFLWFIGLLVYTKELKSNKGASQGWSYSIGWLGFFLVVFSVVYYVFAGVYRLKKPQSSVIQQIYAPLTQWDDVSSSDSEDDRL
ncbi:PREDICTED: epithelial membrane protein 1-like [Amphimedon queenslandica]|nr:PREDICTED: epithelial membrane protein 1-like [Amphimedon queenslandica]|eukprot:XP_019859184.1 PREDICTED: epithelial membrane protein 1-like [Amphimedon queenslandica]